MSSEVPRRESRADFDSLIPWARRLFAEGQSTREVMREIYGADLPSEVYVLDRAYPDRLDLPLDPLFHPWELLVLANPSGTVRGEDPWARRQEENAYAQHPDFLPLLKLGDRDAQHGGYVIGYSLEELRHGRTTVLGHAGDIPATGAKLEVLGTSLFHVMHEWMADRLRMVTEQYRSPENRGAGSLEQRDVDEVAELLRGIEALQKEAAILEAGTL